MVIFHSFLYVYQRAPSPQYEMPFELKPSVVSRSVEDNYVKVSRQHDSSGARIGNPKIKVLSNAEYGFFFLPCFRVWFWEYIYIQSCLVVEVASWCFTVCKVTALLDEMTLMDLMVFSSGSSQAPCATIKSA